MHKKVLNNNRQNVFRNAGKIFYFRAGTIISQPFCLEFQISKNSSLEIPQGVKASQAVDCVDLL